MKYKKNKMLAGVMALAMCVSMLAPMTASAEGFTGWREENGTQFWYENDVKQGTEGRGKEIFDPVSGAWYWLDAPDGIVAKSKDVYQESEAGIWGDIETKDGKRFGKWVRYDENGHMIKGWSADGNFYFDPTFGTMAKGYATIDGVEYYFDPVTGALNNKLGDAPENGWKNIDGNDYWYENGARQGYSVNADYRGKEIFDPASGAWYWLDNIDGGKKAVNKEVYQDSEAGIWGDYVGEDGKRYGKWVRYDENGHMIKGWLTTDAGTYYYDETYGTMAKGYAEIDGKAYQFNENTGICEGEVEQKVLYSWRFAERVTYNGDDNLDNSISYKYDDNGEISEVTKKIYGITQDRKSYLWSESVYTIKDNKVVAAKGFVYDETEEVVSKSESVYNSAGEIEKNTCYNKGTDGFEFYYEQLYEYDSNGYLLKNSTRSADGTYEYKYEYDTNGNVLRTTSYNNGQVTYDAKNQYEDNKLVVAEYTYYYNGKESYTKEETSYDAEGRHKELIRYSTVYVDGVPEIWPVNKYTWVYDGRTETQNRYTYTMNERGEWIAKQIGYEVNKYYETDDPTEKRYESCDSYSGFITVGEDGKAVYNFLSGDEYAYNYGGKYEYDEAGNQTVTYSYTRDENYQKKIFSCTKFYQNDLKESYVLGETTSYTAEEVFDAENKKIYYSVEKYESYKK